MSEDVRGDMDGDLDAQPSPEKKSRWGTLTPPAKAQEVLRTIFESIARRNLKKV